jgi:hypothetical protein
MLHGRVISLAAAAALGIAVVSADAFAARIAARGAVGYHGAAGYRGGAVGYRGGWYGGSYYRLGIDLAAGALVGGTIAASPGYGYGGHGYGGYGYSYSYGRSYASTAGPDSSTSRFIDSRTKTYYDDYCKQRFKKYDSSSGTYLGDDGLRYPCP